MIKVGKNLSNTVFKYSFENKKQENSFEVKAKNTESAPFDAIYYKPKMYTSFKGKSTTDIFAMGGVDLKEEISKIIELTPTDSRSEGGEAIVFPLVGNPEFVMRVDKSLTMSYDKRSLPDRMKLVPIKYPDGFSDNSSLGLPLYAFISDYSDLSELSPDAAMAQEERILLLRKVTGKKPSEDYYKYLYKLVGRDETGRWNDNNIQHRNQHRNYDEFSYYIERCGPEVAKNFLDCCKAGHYSLKSGEYKILSDKEFHDVRAFYDSYKDFTKNYLDTIKKISELPQETFNSAIKTISSMGQYRLDFEHTENTFIDFDKKQINFLDLQLNPEDSGFERFNYDNPIEEFKKVLLGKRPIVGITNTWDLLLYENDKKAFEQYSKVLEDKINFACEF